MAQNVDWNAYEQQTGKKRPPWIDGVGNVNHSYGRGQSKTRAEAERRYNEQRAQAQARRPPPSFRPVAPPPRQRPMRRDLGVGSDVGGMPQLQQMRAWSAPRVDTRPPQFDMPNVQGWRNRRPRLALSLPKGY